MVNADAVAVVSGVWSGAIREDARLPVALAALGMSVEQYRKLAREMRRVSKGRKPFEVLTPTGGLGRRGRS